MPSTPQPTPPPDRRTIIAAPSWETALRAKARDTLAALNTMAVQASPITFTIQGIPVAFSWGATDAVFDINDGMYSLRMPLPWVTGKA